MELSVAEIFTMPSPVSSRLLLLLPKDPFPFIAGQFWGGFSRVSIFKGLCITDKLILVLISLSIESCGLYMIFKIP